MALGEPDRKVETRTEDGLAEVWTYQQERARLLRGDGERELRGLRRGHRLGGQRGRARAQRGRGGGRVLGGPRLALPRPRSQVAGLRARGRHSSGGGRAARLGPIERLDQSLDPARPAVAHQGEGVATRLPVLHGGHAARRRGRGTARRSPPRPRCRRRPTSRSWRPGGSGRAAAPRRRPRRACGRWPGRAAPPSPGARRAAAGAHRGSGGPRSRRRRRKGPRGRSDRPHPAPRT